MIEKIYNISYSSEQQNTTNKNYIHPLHGSIVKRRSIFLLAGLGFFKYPLRGFCAEAVKTPEMKNDQKNKPGTLKTQTCKQEYASAFEHRTIGGVDIPFLDQSSISNIKMLNELS